MIFQVFFRFEMQIIKKRLHQQKKASMIYTCSDNILIGFVMTKEIYIQMTGATNRFQKSLPNGMFLLKLPTYLCAVIYITTIVIGILHRDVRTIRAVLVPAACLSFVTVIRPLIHRPRPYDVFQVPPVGKWKKGKQRSMPSRHAASAVVIAIAVMYLYPQPAVIVMLSILATVICILRVLTGMHYPSDVLVAILIAVAFSVIGYFI